MDNILKLAKRLVEHASYRDVEKIISEEALAIFGADRSCFIAKIKNDLMVESGFPENSHGIGEKITDSSGKRFLSGILNNKMPVVVDRPMYDSKVSYMRDLVIKCHISEILFIPLFTHEEDFGILVLDFINEKKIQGGVFLKLKNFASLAVKAFSAARRRKKEEEELLRMHKLIDLGRNFGAFCHTAKNNLTKIGGLANVLLKSKTLDEKEKDFLKKIIFSVERLEGDMRDILDFLKLKRVELKKTHLNDFLRNQVRDLSILADNCKMKFLGDKRMEKVGVYFDPDLISDVLEDLIFNAIEASSKKIVVSTRLRPKSQSVLISISSDGRRIDPEIKNHIFAPFVTGGSGTGLGLHNAQTIVHLHKGTIKIDDRIETIKGIVSFDIQLPIAIHHS